MLPPPLWALHVEQTLVCVVQGLQPTPPGLGERVLRPCRNVTTRQVGTDSCRPVKGPRPAKS